MYDNLYAWKQQLKRLQEASDHSHAVVVKPEEAGKYYEKYYKEGYKKYEDDHDGDYDDDDCDKYADGYAKEQFQKDDNGYDTDETAMKAYKEGKKMYASKVKEGKIPPQFLSHMKGKKDKGKDDDKEERKSAKESVDALINSVLEGTSPSDLFSQELTEGDKYNTCARMINDLSSHGMHLPMYLEKYSGHSYDGYKNLAEELMKLYGYVNAMVQDAAASTRV